MSDDDLSGLAGHLVSRHVLANWQRDDTSRVSVGSLAGWSIQTAGLGPAVSVRGLFERAADPLCVALGFEPARPVSITDDSVSAVIGNRAPIAMLVVIPWGHPLSNARRPASHAAWNSGVRWALLFNGTHLRLIDVTRAGSRRHAEIAVNRERGLDDHLAYLPLVFGAAALAADDHGRSLVGDIIAASDRHAVDVGRELRTGVLEASALMLRALLGPTADRLDAAFDQSLVLIYRVLFLLFAEARALVPLWHAIYRESYSMQSLCSAAREGQAIGLWDALRAISRLAHCGCHVGDLRISPFNGRLFTPSRVPLAERTNLDDELARLALVALTTRRSVTRGAADRITYRDLGVEQLGAVYETLLDYQPHVDRKGSTRQWTATLRAGGGLRKSTGSFYTPQAIADYLVQETLAPLVTDKTPEEILALRVLDPSMGSGAFLVSACRFLTDAYADALVRSGGHRHDDFGAGERAAMRRRVAERCLFGVDLNPMAVQLAQLSLWLATLAADRPLSFLDHHLLAGDSLVGAWIASLGTAPPRRRAPRRPLPMFEAIGLEAAMSTALPVRIGLSHDPNDSAAQVRHKERALAALNAADHPLAGWKRVADLWCASWFRPELVPSNAFGALADAALGGSGALPAATSRRLLSEVSALARARRFFHWELEFPEVFFDADGTRRSSAGFDAILGNPPWDMVRADSDASPGSRLDDAALVRFSRDSGVYSAQSSGHANRYQLFLERAIALLRPEGRLGLVMPSGLASDHGSARLRQLLMSRCEVTDLIGFDNRQAIFPIHRSVRFLLLSARTGARTSSLRCRFGERDLDVLDHPRQAPLVVTRALLERVSGDDLAIPDLRSPLDMEILEQTTARFAHLGAAESWHARFGRELNASDDRQHFSTGRRGMPVVGGRHISPFQARLDTTEFRIAPTRAADLLGSRHLRPRLAYRDVASAANRVTLIAALLPAGCVSTHTIFVLRTGLDLETQSFLCALFNSWVVNYLVRLRVTTHVTTAIVERLPIANRREAAGSITSLAAAARRLRRGHDSSAVADLNARVARLYGLSRRQFEHLLGTFPLVPASERQMAVRAFANFS